MSTDILLWLENHWMAKGLVSSLAITLILVASSLLISRRIRLSSTLNPASRRRWIVQVRQVTLILLILALLIIWGRELRTFAFSVVAIAAAIVLATKELIMCVSGAILKNSASIFEVGDRIELNEIRGDVFDHGFLSTTLLEVGPGKTVHQYTGRRITLPNSLFLAHPVYNETRTDDYVLHVFRVPLHVKDPWRKAREYLLKAAQKHCAGYLSEAKRHMEKLGQKEGLATLSVEPRVTLNLPEPEKVELVVRIPAPSRRKGRIEQAILNDFMEHYYPDTSAPNPDP